MFATVRHYSGNDALVDALMPHEDAVRRLLREIPGFQAYYLIRTSSGDAVSVSVYEDEAGADASNAAAREFIAANVPDFAASPPEVMAGEVAITA